MDTVKPAFEGAALTKFLEPFVTPKAQAAAIEALEKQGRLNAQAFFYLQRTVDRNHQTTPVDYTPANRRAVTTLNMARQERIDRAHRVMLRRLGRIERAFANQLGKIRVQQARELKTKQNPGGRSLTKIFNNAANPPIGGARQRTRTQTR